MNSFLFGVQDSFPTICRCLFEHVFAFNGCVEAVLGARPFLRSLQRTPQFLLIFQFNLLPRSSQAFRIGRIEESRSSTFAPVSAANVSFVCRRGLPNSSFCPQVAKSRALTASSPLCNAYTLANGFCKGSSIVLQRVSKSRQMELTCAIISSWESSAAA
jgi:hypothetical protein